MSADTFNNHTRKPAQPGELTKAISLGEIACAIDLIERGADVNEQDENGNTPLHYALWRGHVKMTLRLLKEGANLRKKDRLGRTPLMLAVACNSDEIVLALLKKKININEQDIKTGNTALILAVTLG